MPFTMIALHHQLRRPGRRSSYRLLALGLVIALALVACRDPAPQTCPDGTDPAVELQLIDETGAPLIGAGLRYRIDQGPWLDWPENLGRTTTIRGAPGRYELQIARQGYASQATTLDVPPIAADSCRPLVQNVALQLTLLPCPEPPSPLSLTIDPPLGGLQVSLMSPDSGRQLLACQEPAGDACRAFSFNLAALGDYQLQLADLPGLGPMQLIDNRVAYDPPALQLRLDHRGVQATAEVSGAEEVTLRFTTRRDETNCPLADLPALQTSVADDQQPRPPLALHYQGSLTMTDLGAEACRAEPVLTDLTFAADLPAGTDLADVQVTVDYGDGWSTAACQVDEGRYICRTAVPNPLVGRPFVARITAGEQVASGLSLPFSGLCLLFQ